MPDDIVSILCWVFAICLLQSDGYEEIWLGKFTQQTSRLCIEESLQTWTMLRGTDHISSNRNRSQIQAGSLREAVIWRRIPWSWWYIYCGALRRLWRITYCCTIAGFATFESLKKAKNLLFKMEIRSTAIFRVLYPCSSVNRVVLIESGSLTVFL